MLSIEEIRKSWEDPDITTVPIRKSWRRIFEKEFKQDYFQKRMKVLQKNIKENPVKLVFPAKENVFKAFNLCPWSQLKVVIVGQDCYHSKPNEACGLCFSVPKEVSIPPSLQNIFREIKREIYSVHQHGDLTYWAKQGVLLMNSALTVWQKDPLSHMRYWEDFTDNIIKYISKEKKGIVFLLWGRHAQNKAAFIDKEKHLILMSQHPSPLATGKVNPFYGNGHFTEANKYLESQDKKPIEWNIY
jgi:uracil-DNA glycosylase